MKILHTADWHIGKILHKHPLQDELVLFFDWLLETIDGESVDLLLVSGDIFDLANPSAKDRQLYYGFLRRLFNKDIKIIITGGNHDSVGFLNAPSELLDELNITIIGGATDLLEDELIEIKNDLGEIELVVAAVPFLRDKDLRNRETDELYKNRTEAIREGIKKHYADLAEICKTKYSGVPMIAMGHLYVVGASTSESERDIHVGNAAAIESTAFPTCFNYVALGHIHRPQIIGKNEFIRYSGSPIALSFSEKKDTKSVLIVEMTNGNLNPPQLVEVPKFRELKKITGDLESVKTKLAAYNPNFPLVSFVELAVVEEIFQTSILIQIEELVQLFNDGSKFKILKNKPDFIKGKLDTSDFFIEGQNIEDLSPLDVFTKRLESEGLETPQMSEMKESFLELLELVEQSEEA